MATMSSDTGFLSSPRAQRRLLLGSAAIFIVGLIVFVSVYALRGTSGPANVFHGKAKFQQHLTKAPVSNTSRSVARTFMETVVQRKNMDVAYPLVAHTLIGNESKKQWLSGNNPVVPYWSNNVKTAHFLVDWSYKDRVLFEVDLVAKPGTNQRPHLLWYLGERKIKGQWKVNYWLPHWTAPVPMGPAAGN